MPVIPSTFTMQFEPTTIEHLGLRLYSSLPPVVGELVSNAWDADATEVKISIPVGTIEKHAEVKVEDNGNGMTPTEVQAAYLFIGRDRRAATRSDRSERLKRNVTGRKGLGKLSAFGIADKLAVRTVSQHFATSIVLDLEDMKSCASGTQYKPAIIKKECGQTSAPNGTTITIRNLRRQRPIDERYVKEELARRFRFLGEDFRVFVNGNEVLPSDTRQRSDCRISWDVADLKSTDVVDEHHGWKVTGWMGLVAKSSQINRGIDIFARGKAAELDTMFNVQSTHVQFARAYVVGEINAEFLDSDEDRISTARNSVNWASEAGQRLQDWGQIALKDVFDRWLIAQHKEKRDQIVTTSNFDEWLKTRTSREQKIANRLIKVIVDDPDIDPESAAPLLDVIKANVEFQAFQELVDEIEESGSNARVLLKLFRDWRVIEAREHLKLSDGRLEAMEKLAGFIESGALEVQQMQPLFEKHSWLIDPSWGSVSGQDTYSSLLRKQFPEDVKTDVESRRLDLLGVRLSSEINIVELKRPERKLHLEDLGQIERYVDWARGNLLSSGEDSPKYARGLLIVGELSSKAELQQKLRRLAGDDIRVETYGDLLHRARKVYGEVQERLKSIAPEYTSEARRRRGLEQQSSVDLEVSPTKKASANIGKKIPDGSKAPAKQVAKPRKKK